MSRWTRYLGFLGIGAAAVGGGLVATQQLADKPVDPRTAIQIDSSHLGPQAKQRSAEALQKYEADLKQGIVAADTGDYFAARGHFTNAKQWGSEISDPVARSIALNKSKLLAHYAESLENLKYSMVNVRKMILEVNFGPGEKAYGEFASTTLPDLNKYLKTRETEIGKLARTTISEKGLLNAALDLQKTAARFMDDKSVNPTIRDRATTISEGLNSAINTLRE